MVTVIRSMKVNLKKKKEKNNKILNNNCSLLDLEKKLLFYIKSDKLSENFEFETFFFPHEKVMQNKVLDSEILQITILSI